MVEALAVDEHHIRAPHSVTQSVGSRLQTRTALAENKPANLVMTAFLEPTTVLYIKSNGKVLGKGFHMSVSLANGRSGCALTRS